MSGSVSFFSIMFLIKINMFVANMRFNIIWVSGEARCSGELGEGCKRIKYSI